MKNVRASANLCLLLAGISTTALYGEGRPSGATRETDRASLEAEVMAAILAYAEGDPTVKDMLARIDQAKKDLAKYRKEASAAGRRITNADRTFSKLRDLTSTRPLWRYAGRKSPRVRAAIDAHFEHYPANNKREFIHFEVLPTDTPAVEVVFPAADATTPKTFAHTVRDGEKTYTIDFTRFSLYAPDCKFRYTAGEHPYERDPAKYPEFSHGPDRTYLGKIRGNATWLAVGYKREDGAVRGLILGERRQSWMDFEGDRVIRHWPDNGHIRDNYFRYADIPLPTAGYRSEPVYDLSMGLEISYHNLLKAGGRMPALFEQLEMALAEVLTAFRGHCRIRIRLKQIVVRSNMKTCPYAARFANEHRWMSGLPEEYFPELTKEERTKHMLFKIGSTVWRKIWPDLKLDRRAHLHWGSAAALGGDSFSFRMYPSVRPKPYDTIPCDEQMGAHTIMHELSHTFRGMHFTGGEEGMTAYTGVKPGPLRIVGSFVVKYRKHYESKCRDRGEPVSVTRENDDVPLPPYASLDMLRVDNTEERRTIDILGNDFDYNDDPIKLVDVDRESRRGGTIADSGNGVVVYSPPAHKVGLDRFKYRIADSTGFESVGYVIIRITSPSRRFVIAAPSDAKGTRFTGGKLAFSKGRARGGTVEVLPITVTTPEKGLYNVILKYHIPGSVRTGVSPRRHTIKVNGEALYDELFAVRQGEPIDDWKWKTFYSVPLSEGENTVEIASVVNEALTRKTRRGTTRASTAPTTINSIEITPADFYTVNFRTRPRGGESPSGILDTGETFKKRPNGLEYGWSKQARIGYCVSTARDLMGRVAGFDVDDGNEWEMSLPNGKYNVLLCAGGRSDRSVMGFHQYKTSIFFEGSGKFQRYNDFLVESVPFQGEREPENAYESIEHQVTISDGRLTVEAGKEAKDAGICYINICRAE